MSPAGRARSRQPTVDAWHKTVRRMRRAGRRSGHKPMRRRKDSGRRTRHVMVVHTNTDRTDSGPVATIQPSRLSVPDTSGCLRYPEVACSMYRNDMSYRDVPTRKILVRDVLASRGSQPPRFPAGCDTWRVRRQAGTAPHNSYGHSSYGHSSYRYSSHTDTAHAQTQLRGDTALRWHGPVTARLTAGSVRPIAGSAQTNRSNRRIAAASRPGHTGHVSVTADLR